MSFSEESQNVTTEFLFCYYVFSETVANSTYFICCVSKTASAIEQFKLNKFFSVVGTRMIKRK